jgi:hypothetical protein
MGLGWCCWRAVVVYVVLPAPTGTPLLHYSPASRVHPAIRYCSCGMDGCPDHQPHPCHHQHPFTRPLQALFAIRQIVMPGAAQQDA